MRVYLKRDRCLNAFGVWCEEEKTFYNNRLILPTTCVSSMYRMAAYNDDRS